MVHIIRFILLSETPAAGHRRTPKQLSKQSARTVCASAPSQGSAARGQGENNCHDFRREFYPLSKKYAATSPEVHENITYKSFLFLRFCDDVWVREPLGSPRNQSCKKYGNMVSFWRQGRTLFSIMLAPKSELRALFWFLCCCLFLASLLGGVR